MGKSLKIVNYAEYLRIITMVFNLNVNPSKKILYFVIVVVLILLATKYIIDAPYRNKLPELPQTEAIQKPFADHLHFTAMIAKIFPTSKNLGRLGLVYYAGSYFEKAERCFVLAIRNEPSEWEWSYYLGYLKLEQGESNSVVDHMKNVIKHKPQSLMASFYLGRAYVNLGMNAEAENEFKQIYSSKVTTPHGILRDRYFPLKAYAGLSLARILSASNRLDEAETLLKEILSDQPTFGPGYRLLGNIYTMKGEMEQGVRYTILANDFVEYEAPGDSLIDQIALLSKSDLYLLKLIDRAIRSENFRWGLKLCENGLSFAPENKYLVSGMLCVLFNLNRDKEAIELIDRHYKLFSNDYKEIMDVADLLYNRGHVEYADKYFNRARLLQPNNVELVKWLLKCGMQNQAINLLNLQLYDNPNHPGILTQAVYYYLTKGMKEQALEYFDKLKTLAPDDPELIKINGLIKEYEDNFDQAISYYRQAFDIKPNDNSLVKYLLTVYQRTNSWKEALDTYRKALETNPNEPYLMEGLGELLVSCPDTKFRNIEEGLEFSGRTFLSFRSSFQLRLDAGRNLATGYAMLNNRGKAQFYIDKTLSAASIIGAEKTYTAYFRELQEKFNIPFRID